MAAAPALTPALTPLVLALLAAFPLYSVAQVVPAVTRPVATGGQRVERLGGAEYLPPGLVGREVAGDREEPGPHRGARLPAGGPPDQAQEGLLGQVLGAGPLAGEPEQEGVDRRAVSEHERLEGPRVAALEPPHELLVGLVRRHGLTRASAR